VIKDYGFKAVCFDKDNVLTRPNQMSIHKPFRESLLRAMSHFHCAILSNSVFNQASLLVSESMLIDCIPHKLPKPFCVRELLVHFKGIANSEILFIGDRLLTDIYMANKLKMFSIYVNEPISIDDESGSQRLMRKLENWCAKKLPKTRPFEGIQTEELTRFIQK
jgi:HAD superfamily phosphatase (TIGR01668 family)